MNDDTPAYPPIERRTVRVTLRLKPSELDRLKELAALAGMDISDYIRVRALRKDRKPRG